MYTVQLQLYYSRWLKRTGLVDHTMTVMNDTCNLKDYDNVEILMKSDSREFNILFTVL